MFLKEGNQFENKTGKALKRGVSFSCAFFDCRVRREAGKPVFVKELVAMDDMDVAVYFISDKDWDKKVKTVKIPEFAEDMEVAIYEENIEESGRYQYHILELGFDVNDVEFSKVQITWDDGTKTTADIGHIQIQDFNESGKFSLPKTSEGESEEELTISYRVKTAMDLTGVDIPFEAEMGNWFQDIRIDGTPLKEISEKHPLKLEKGDAFTVSYKCVPQLETEYNSVYLNGLITGIDGQGKKHVTPLRLWYQGDAEIDAGAYLKRLEH